MVVMMAAHMDAERSNVHAYPGLCRGRGQKAGNKNARKNAFHVIPVSWT
jgi:hypothetical protein